MYVDAIKSMAYSLLCINLFLLLANYNHGWGLDEPNGFLHIPKCCFYSIVSYTIYGRMLSAYTIFSSGSMCGRMPCIINIYDHLLANKNIYDHLTRTL